MDPILVTGAGGFLGRAITSSLLERGDAVIALEAGNCQALDIMTAGSTRLDIVRGDICDVNMLDAVFARYRPRNVIHCAAVVGVIASLQAPQQLFRVNVEGSANLLEAMVRHGSKRLVHISSEEIYGAFNAGQVDEEHPQNPVHAYGISKAAVEHLGRSYREAYGIECINIRTSWIYGPDFPRDRVPLNMIRAVARREALHVPGGADERIDHTYLDDAVAGTLAALNCTDHPYDAYHVSSQSSPSLSEIAAILAELDPYAPPVSVGDGPYRHAGRVAMPRKGTLDCSRARQAFGYVPRFDIRAGLAATLKAERAAIKGTGLEARNG